MMPSVGQDLGQVQIGDGIGTVTVKLTTQRLVMEAAASRSFTPIHHDRKFAVAAGTPDITASVIFVQGLFEMAVRQWMGPGGRLRALSVRLTGFLCAGDTVECSGHVSGQDGAGTVQLELRQSTARGAAAIAVATVELHHE